MDAQSFDLQMQRWRDLNPGLRRVSDGFSELSRVAAVSYPADSHATLAALEDRSFWFGHRNELISTVVSRLPPSGPIYDVGGGNGFVSKGLSRAGFDCVVMEPGVAGARMAEARGIPVVQAAFEELTLLERSLSAIGLFDVLELKTILLRWWRCIAR